MTPPDEETVTYTVDIRIGDVWIDPDEVSWYVKGFHDDRVQLERTAVKTRPVRELARNWRRPNDPA